MAVRKRTLLFSPGGMALRAIELAVIFVMLHLLGIRRYTSVLCGTFGAGYGGAFAGMLYVLFYLASVVLAPILIIAAAIWGAYNRVTGKKEPKHPHTQVLKGE